MLWTTPFYLYPSISLIVGIPIALVSVLPSDTALVTLVLASYAAFSGVVLVTYAFRATTEISHGCRTFGAYQNLPCPAAHMHSSSFVVMVLWAAHQVLLHMWLCVDHRVHPRHKLDVLWLNIGRTYFVWGLITTAWIIGDTVFEAVPTSEHFTIGSALCAGVLCVLGALCAHRSARIQLQGWIASQTNAASTAAAVASMLGKYEAAEVLSLARRTFLCAELTEDLAYVVRDNSLLTVRVPAARLTALGNADAFVSHSWSDPPEAKWALLQAWRERFVATHRREPLVWLDKVSLPQVNATTLEDRLACLPVYLAGANRLVIVLGGDDSHPSTWCRRLWCIIELYCWLLMGKDVAHIETLVGGKMERMTSEVEAFRVENAACTHAGQRDALLAAIEAGSYSLAEFNARVRSTLTDVLGLQREGGSERSPLARHGAAGAESVLKD